MQKTDRERAIALAALFQATSLVRDIAYTGQANAADTETCLRSLFKIDATDIDDVFGGLQGLRRGLSLLAAELRTPKEMEIARYTVNLLVLERRLRGNTVMNERLADGLRTIETRLEHFPLLHENIIAALGELYSNTISTLQPRIMVNGEQMHLAQTDKASRIRALLLAGIRAAVLWAQAGGGRFTLLWRRGALREEAQRLRAQLDD